MPLTAEDVAEITRLLEESQFDELHLEHAGFKLTLKRGAALRREEATASAPAASPAPASAASASDASVLEVTAPFVGIFYRAPRPGAPPYIEVGSKVEEDTTVGIIEVMKLMNAVRAEVSGTVVEVLVEDGAVVEYGQVLLRIAPGAPGG
ncbi:MAG TPA: acetyl-CoA carboxylase biotin carboxyl carrier protein [Steroidobacteraceae bacterium]|nr:acetyl-CoA carboxylase biotin carboxyl carrier protein [Steroidobacteraceae bacterium]